MSDNVQAQLTDVKGAAEATGGRLSEMSAHVSLDIVQDARSGGIELELEYLNDGPESVELFDPLDQIQYMLLDAAGYPVKTPPFVSRLLTDPWDETGAGLADRFSIVSIRENGREKDVREEVGKKTIMVESGGGYRITLRIRKIMDDGTPTTAIDIPPGAYGIVLTCSLVTHAGGSDKMRLLQSERLMVSLE